MGKQAYIEINGKKYDVATGKMIQSTAPAAPSASHSKSSPASTPVQKTSLPVTQSSAVRSPHVRPAMNIGAIDGFGKKPVNIATNHAVKQAQRSQTLMRKSVPKPQKVSQPATIRSDKSAIHTSTFKAPLSRQHHAAQIQKSRSIQKFNNSPQPNTSVVKKDVPLHIKPAPSAAAPQPSHTYNVAQISTPTTSTSSKTQRHLDRALASANSHEQFSVPYSAKHKRRGFLSKKLGVSSRAASFSLFVLAIAVLGGFFAIQNVPNLAMRVAATRAGFDASMPAYKPSGFSYIGPINYSTGKVTVSFRSTADERAYSITQTSSNWNSDALLANYIIDEGKQYQTFVDKGRTLYIYDGSNATWVDNGIWYQIEGNSSLTTDQLVRIASSI